MGHYRIVRRLGIGETCEVLLAYAEGPMSFRRTVALKRLLPGIASKDRERELLREAIAYSRLNHPAIVRLYDFFEDRGRAALVLEHIDGVSVSRLRAALRARDELLPYECAIWLAARVFFALSAAHNARDALTSEFSPVIHRDVSPGNVLVPWDGYAKLVDFGIARLSGVESTTRPGTIKGTDGFMAPEQVTGSAVTVRTDIYAACVLTRDLILGQPSFPREGKSELEYLRSMAEPELVPTEAVAPRVSRRLGDALRRGLARDPEMRSLSADEMVTILRAEVDLEAARVRLVDIVTALRRADRSLSAPEHVPAPDIDEDLDTYPTPATPELSAELIAQETITSRPPAPDGALAPHGADGHGGPFAPTSMVVPIGSSTAAPHLPPAALAPAPLPNLHLEARPMVRLETPPYPTPAALVRDADPTHEAARRRDRAGRSRVGGFLAAACLAAVAGSAIGSVLALRERDGAVDLRRLARTTASPAKSTPAPAPAAAPRATGATVAPVAPTMSPSAPTKAVTSAATRPSSSPSPDSSGSPAASASPPLSPSPALPPAPADKGYVLTPESEKGHRLFVNGRFRGAAGTPLLVGCGTHEVKIGSAGTAHQVAVPCGGSVTVDP